MKNLVLKYPNGVRRVAVYATVIPTGIAYFGPYNKAISLMILTVAFVIALAYRIWLDKLEKKVMDKMIEEYQKLLDMNGEQMEKMIQQLNDLQTKLHDTYNKQKG